MKAQSLTFGEGVRLDNVEESVDYVEEEPDGPRLVVSVGVINRRGDKPEVQRFHRRRGPLSAGVRLPLSREPLVLQLLAASGPPAEQQDEPPGPQHGSESPVSSEGEIKVNGSPLWRDGEDRGDDGGRHLFLSGI